MPGSPTLVRSLPEGLDTVVGDRGYRMSGGEKQRLAIARVLLKAPGIVILDEATAHLDSESEVAVQHALDAALDRPDVAGDRAPAVDDPQRRPDPGVDGGRIMESGTHDELLALGGRYADLYRTQFADGERRTVEVGLSTSVTPVPVAQTEAVKQRDAAHPYDAQIRALYSQFLDGWNRRSGAAVAAGFADDGDIIGFDGTHHRGRLSIAADLRQMFASHQTPAYVGVVRSVRPMAHGRRGAAGARRHDPGRAATTSTPTSTPCTRWSPSTRAAAAGGSRCFQSTPAAWHQHPEAREALTAGAARPARPAVTVLVPAAELRGGRGRVVLLDVRWALGDDRRARAVPGRTPARRGLRRPRDRAGRSAVGRRRAAPAAVVTATAGSGAALGDPRRRRRSSPTTPPVGWPPRAPGGCCAGAA